MAKKPAPTAAPAATNRKKINRTKRNSHSRVALSKALQRQFAGASSEVFRILIRAVAHGKNQHHLKKGTRDPHANMTKEQKDIASKSSHEVKWANPRNQNNKQKHRK